MNRQVYEYTRTCTIQQAVAYPYPTALPLRRLLGNRQTAARALVTASRRCCLYQSSLITYTKRMAGASNDGPTQYRKASDWAVGWLRDSIIAGHLKAGQPLKLQDLCEQTGLSTTPIREALSRLRDEGFVEGDSHRTFQVTAISIGDIRDYYMLHAFLSGLMAERAATRLSEANLAELRELDVKMRERSEAGDAAGLYDLNFAFQRIINDAGSTPAMRRFIAMTSRLVSRRTFPDVQGWSYSIVDHAVILEALENRDGVKARDAMERLIMNICQVVTDDLKSRGWEE